MKLLLYFILVAAVAIKIDPNQHLKYGVRFQTRIDSGDTISLTKAAAFHVHVNINMSSYGVLKITQIDFYYGNDRYEDPQAFQPLQNLLPENVTKDLRQNLSLPWVFKISSNQIEEVFFNQNDSFWSMNTKRIILNMLNIQNLTKHHGSNVEEEATAFVVPEETLDGACHSIYNIAPTQGSKYFEVNKSIDYEACSQIATPLQYFLDYSPAFILQNCNNRSAEYWYKLYGNLSQYDIYETSYLSTLNCSFPSSNDFFNVTTIMRAKLYEYYPGMPTEVDVAEKGQSVLYSTVLTKEILNISMINGTCQIMPFSISLELLKLSSKTKRSITLLLLSYYKEFSDSKYWEMGKDNNAAAMFRADVDNNRVGSDQSSCTSEINGIHLSANNEEVAVALGKTEEDDDGDADPQCVDHDGNPVFFYFIFKLPKLVIPKVKAPDNIITTGKEYFFYSSQDKVMVEMEDITISALDHTLKRFSQHPQKADFLEVKYNDQLPPNSQRPKGVKRRPRGSGSNAVPQPAHAKGVLHFGKKGGMFLSHSFPRYPVDYDFREEYGRSQHFMCFTIDKDSLEVLSEMIYGIGPNYMKDPIVPPELLNLGKLNEIYQQKSETKSSDDRKTINIEKLGRVTIFYKSRFTFWYQLWDAVEEYFKCGFTMKTHIAQRETGSYVNSRNYYNARTTVQLEDGRNVTYYFPKDHVKIAYAVDPKNKIVCVGDLNYERSQENRSGMIMCFKDEKMWDFLTQKLEPLEVKDLTGDIKVLKKKLGDENLELEAEEIL